MSRKTEILVTIGGDVFLLFVAFFISWEASGIDQSIIGVHGITANILILVYWLFLFQTANLYLTRAKVRLMNELYKMFQVIVIGLIILISATLI